MKVCIILFSLIAPYFDVFPVVHASELKDQGEIHVPIDQDQVSQTSVSRKFSIFDLQELLFTEVDDEIDVINAAIEKNGRDPSRRTQELNRDAPLPASEAVFDHIVEHAWQLSKSQINDHHASRLLTSTQSLDYQDLLFPYLVCSRTPLLKSGIQRLSPLLQFTGAQSNDAVIISNDDKQSCFQISTTFNKASIVDSTLSDDEYVIVPMADLMKISTNTFKQIEDESWAIPSPEDIFRSSLKSQDSNRNWERLLSIGFVPGLNLSNATDVLTAATTILNTVKQMGVNGSVKQQRRLKKSNNVTSDEDLPPSLSDLFSVTSSLAVTESNRRRTEVVIAGRQWTRILQNGIEADHVCQIMFDQLEIRTNSDMKQFDIVLNPQKNYDEFMKQSLSSFEATASNKDCVRSLIVGLSIHPHVLSIEAELPISVDDFESQWITQTNTQGSRPFYDRGLTGRGQIVSITDSGLDINHKYFGPTGDAVFQRWVMTERKVVRYDFSQSGDKSDFFQGHGTRVAGVIAGNAGDDADGIAKDAKIHIFDLTKEGGQMVPPDPSKLFPSIYNNGRGAKITNASWSSGYRPYTFRCRIFDSFLNEKYDGIIFIASAGNAANDIPGKVKKTIGDPSSCKNILSVGASQSHGKRLFPGDKGKDYLADFSSRGPTADGRMKPDIVAPGYRILAPRAHAKQHNYDETYETFGTSFSAPVVAGNAALIRQYFDEGWFPCGSKGCSSTRINPSGSLVKAILMNGAIQSIKNVQKVPAGTVLETVREYDNNAGMGLVNMINSLPIKGLNDMNAVAINNHAISDGRSDYVTVKIKSCGVGSNKVDSLRATLTWYDPAGSVNCAKCLINDLDLIVEKVNGSRVEGTLYPNGLNGKDKTNNVERVRITSAPASGTYRITVKASNLATRSQKYSLIITGCFDKLEEALSI